MSTQLREAGEEIARIGRAMEESQLEDGDGPVAIGFHNYLRLLDALQCVTNALRDIAVESVREQ
jgi:hypothetical protein